MLCKEVVDGTRLEPVVVDDPCENFEIAYCHVCGSRDDDRPEFRIIEHGTVNQNIGSLPEETGSLFAAALPVFPGFAFLK